MNTSYSHSLKPNSEESFPWDNNQNTKSLQRIEHKDQQNNIPDKDTTETYPWENIPRHVNDSILNTATSFDDQDNTTHLHHIGSKQKNWPRCYPLVRHDIDHDIPLVGRKYVQKNYFIWKLLILLYLLNLAAIISCMVSRVPKYNNVGGLVLAICYLVIVPFIAFFVWHMTLYRAVKSNSTFFFLVFFIIFFIQICQCIFLAVGISDGGGGGLIVGIDMFSKGYIAPGIISTTCFVCSLFLIYLSFKHIYSIGILYRHGGHSLDAAKKEAAMYAMQNKTIQKSAMKNATNSV